MSGAGSGWFVGGEVRGLCGGELVDGGVSAC